MLISLTESTKSLPRDTLGSACIGLLAKFFCKKIYKIISLCYHHGKKSCILLGNISEFLHKMDINSVKTSSNIKRDMYLTMKPYSDGAIRQTGFPVALWCVVLAWMP